MWFKNLQIYRLPAPWGIGLATLEDQLSRGAFHPCPSNSPISRGWTPPRADGGLIYSSNRQWLLALTIEQRLLPAYVINQAAQARADDIAAEQGYPPGRKQMKEIRERITEELLPRAFPRKRITHAWIDPVNGWLVVDAGSQAKAEEVIEHLRFCLGEFPLKPLLTNLSPQAAMAHWLAGSNAPAGFTIDRDCELKSVAEEKAAVRYVRHPLDGDGMDKQVCDHIAAGKLPTRLALTWNEGLWDALISFTLTEKLEIKRLVFLDVVKKEAAQGVENAADQFEVDFALMTGELARFLPALVEALGGECREKS